MDLYTHKFEIAEQVRLESKKNWMLITQMKDKFRNENRYLITKRQEISEALKETLRINNAIKKQKEKTKEMQKEKMRREVGKCHLLF